MRTKFIEVQDGEYCNLNDIVYLWRKEIINEKIGIYSWEVELRTGKKIETHDAYIMPILIQFGNNKKVGELLRGER